MAVIVSGINYENDCKGCLSCVFHWNGDSCTYCIAQGSRTGERIHRINYTDWDKISEECKDAKERYQKQMEWKEPTCPLKSVDGLIDHLRITGTSYIYEQDVFRVIREYCGEGNNG